MGVIYKLKDEVVHFIIGQRQSNPFLSCRQLAESASQQFGVRFSKSSIHDVLKESGVESPRGRKPKDKFQIPIEKKKQIQISLSKVLLVPQKIEEPASVVATNDSPPKTIPDTDPLQKGDIYEGAGKIFLKAALWDLGIFSVENIKEADWNYYLTYTSSIKVELEDKSSYTIDWLLPLHRSIREVADGLINNIKPLIVTKVSDENLFKTSMEARAGYKINNIALVDAQNHIMCEFSSIVDVKRQFIRTNRVFVESNNRNLTERAKTLFFSQIIDNNKVMDNILNLKGFDATNKENHTINILIEDGYANKDTLLQAMEKLNGMFLRDEQNKLVKITISGG